MTPACDLICFGTGFGGGRANILFQLKKVASTKMANGLSGLELKFEFQFVMEAGPQLASESAETIYLTYRAGSSPASHFSSADLSLVALK